MTFHHKQRKRNMGNVGKKTLSDGAKKIGKKAPSDGAFMAYKRKVVNITLFNSNFPYNSIQKPPRGSGALRRFSHPG